MKFAVLFVLVTACAPVDARAPATPTPQIVYVTPTPVPTFTPKRFGVQVVAIPDDDPAPQRIADYLTRVMPTAWTVATAGRSLLASGSDVLIVVDSSANQHQLGWGLSAPQRLIVVHADIRAPMDLYTKMVIHELGHVIGCCRGTGSDGIHVADCPTPLPPVGAPPNTLVWPTNGAIMCPQGGGGPTFNDYELAQMGL